MLNTKSRVTQVPVTAESCAFDHREQGVTRWLPQAVTVQQSWGHTPAPKGLSPVVARGFRPAVLGSRPGQGGCPSPHPGRPGERSSEGRYMPLGMNKPTLGGTGTGTGGRDHSYRATTTYNIYRHREEPLFLKQLPGASEGPEGKGSGWAGHPQAGQRRLDRQGGQPVARSPRSPGLSAGLPGTHGGDRGWSPAWLGAGADPRLQGHTSRAGPRPAPAPPPPRPRPLALTPTGSPAPRSRKT